MANGLEKVVSNVKKAVATGIAGSMLLTYFPMKAYSEWEEKSRDVVIEELGKTARFDVDYKIHIDKASLLMGELIQIPITKTKTKNTYHQYNDVVRGIFEEYSVKQEYTNKGALIVGGIISGIGLLIAATSENAGPGLLISLVGSGFISDAEKSKEEVKTYTGQTKKEDIYSELREELISEGKIVYKNQPASDINVSFTANGESANYFKAYHNKTDSNGNFVINTSNVYDKFNLNTWTLYSSEFSENKLISQIKPSIRDSIIKKITSKVSNEELGILELTTTEQNTEDSVITNDSKTINPSLVRLESLTDEQIYNSVREFINERINSKIKKVGLRARDIYAYNTLTGAEFEFLSDSPDRIDLLKPYFGDTMIGSVKDYVLSYAKKANVFKANGDFAEFNVYIPTDYRIRATCPKYHYKEFTINFTKPLNKDDIQYNPSDLRGTVLMMDVGEKIRAKPVVK